MVSAHSKAPKDPNAPKRPTTPFMAWRKQNYQNVAKTMAVGHSFKELQAEFGVAWRKLSDAETKPFKDAFKTAMEKHQKLMKAYKQTSSYAAFQKKLAAFKVEKVSKAKFKKDPNAPKKPLSGYFLFLADKREEVKTSYPNLSHKEQLAKMGNMWKEAGEAVQKSYNDKAAAEKKEYQVKLAKYKESEQYKEYTEEKAEFTKAKKKKLTTAKRKTVSLEDQEGDDEERPKKRAKKSAKRTSKKAKKGSKKPKAPKASKKKASKKASKKAGKKKSKRAPRKAKASK